ncbi:hypothetical protein [Candidatus Nitrososphaera gargensis]|nr:hypothetical protein [Candidatus Nitrososphaera gargensis]
MTGLPPLSSSGTYDLFINNQTFEIDYSFSGGKRKDITQIAVDQSTPTMTFSLRTVSDGQLIITMPMELAEQVFKSILVDELAVFVDDLNVAIEQTTDSTTSSFIFVVPVEKRPETLELVGTCPI